MRNFLFLTSLLCCAPTLMAAPDCKFQQWEAYGKAKVVRHDPTGSYMFSSLGVKVDADGAPNAYHPDDVGLHCTKGKGFRGLDCPANAGYPKSTWWSSVIVPDPQNSKKGYVQPDGEFNGYFVSQTSLKDERKRSTDPLKYVNAAAVPYLVLPGNFYKRKGTGQMGDFGYALNIENGRSSSFIVAEVGPSSADLGEMSIALGRELGGNSPNPRTGSGSPTGKIAFVVFPKSRNTPAWPMTQAEINSKVDELLESVGGADALRDCADILD